MTFAATRPIAAQTVYVVTPFENFYRLRRVFQNQVDKSLQLGQILIATFCFLLQIS